MIRISVREADFDAGAELALLQAHGVGGIASFIGTVRANADDKPPLVALYLEHYPGMTERALSKIAEQATAQWPLTHCTIIHRVGRLTPRENIVFVGAASPHRQAALSATAFLIDWLKTSAPIWKREDFGNGNSKWVAPLEADDRAAERWLNTKGHGV
jgi:molybdopterin synthase catalytic subunit